MTPQEFFSEALPAAYKGQHVFPEYACCEAALESAWGDSRLAVEAKNLFGMKQPHDPKATQYPVLELPTHEWDAMAKAMVPATANWPIYPDWATSFSERMATLRRVSLYASALAAKTGEEFVHLVSLHWSTDPLRANNVLRIHEAHKDLLVAQ